MLVEQSDAFALTALHFHDVSDGMDTPEVCGVDLQSLPSGPLRDGVVAAFLIGERSAGEDCAIAGQVPIPFRQDLFGGSTHGLGSAQPKVVEVSKPEGEQVHRMLGDDIVPDGQASIDVPGDPGIQRVHVGTFPRGGVQAHGASGASCFYSDRDVGQPVGEHREIAAETVCQSKLGVGSESLRKMLRGIRAVFQIGTERALKAGSALRRGCGNGQSMLVPKHDIPSSRLRKQGAPGQRARTGASVSGRHRNKYKRGPTGVRAKFSADLGAEGRRGIKKRGGAADARALPRERREWVEVSRAEGLRVAGACGRACAPGESLPPSRALFVRKVFRSDREASSRGRCPRAASFSSAP